MIDSPILARELATAPRRGRLHVMRALYVGALLLVATTAWQLLAGTQLLRGAGAMARFGAAVFQILAPVQLVAMSLYAALIAALAVGQEKDRRTLPLLLMTRLTNRELVFGKLSASLAVLASLWLASWPFFGCVALLGGVGFDQIARTQLVTFASLLLGGSLGTLLGFWREKTFQSLALVVIVLVLWTALGEAVASGLLGASLAGYPAPACVAVVSPWHAVVHAARPVYAGSGAMSPWTTTCGFLGSAALAAAVVNGIAVWRVRAWNTTLEPARHRPADEAPPATDTVTTSNAARHARAVWRNPILWREVRTWAYGRRVLLFRLSYLVLCALSAVSMAELLATTRYPSRWELALPIVPLAMLSLLLINAQAVTSLTSERDSQALDLLLVTDLTSREFLGGKLGGVFYNTKEMIVLPLALVAWLVGARQVLWQTMAYVALGWLVLCAFAAVLGLHAGLHYARSRSAISVSLGTLLFLMLGVATTMRVMVAFAGSFGFQLQPFLAAMVGGGVGLYVALGARSPSPALLAAAFFCPLATFYALTSFLLGHTLAVFLAITSAYGFNIAAMLIPALHEFHVASAADADA